MIKLKSWKCLFLLCLIIPFILVSTSCTQQKGTADNTEARIDQNPINLSSNSTKPLDIVLMIDQSGSMNGYANVPATDPSGLRVNAGKYFVDNISVKSSVEYIHRIGIVNFGSQSLSKFQFPISDANYLNQKSVDLINNSIQKLDLENTNFIDGIVASRKLFDNANTLSLGRQPVLVIFTDGKPDDGTSKTINEYLPLIKNSVKQYLDSLGCKIYIIGINSDPKQWLSSLVIWEQILPKNQILTIQNMGDLKYVFNEVIRQLFNIPSVEPEYLGNEEKEFYVMPYIENIEFHVFYQNESNELVITNPSGEIINNQNNKEVSIVKKGDLYIYLLNEPVEGAWKYKLKNPGGKVLVYKNFIPTKLDLISPLENHPLGKESPILFKFLKKDGKPVKSLDNAPLRFGLSVLDPSGHNMIQEKLEFLDDEAGILQSKSSFLPSKSGYYTFRIDITSGKGYDLKIEKKVQILNQPFISILNPIKNSVIHSQPQKNIFVSATLKNDYETVYPENYFSTHPDLLMRGQIFSLPTQHFHFSLDQNKDANSYWLDYDKEDKTQFNMNIPQPQTEGFYCLLLEYKGQLKNGTIIQDQNYVTFEIRKGLVDVFLLKVNNFFSKYIFLWIAQLIAVIIWIMRRKKNTINLIIKKKVSPIRKPISNKKVKSQKRTKQKELIHDNFFGSDEPSSSNIELLSENENEQHGFRFDDDQQDDQRIILDKTYRNFKLIQLPIKGSHNFVGIMNYSDKPFFLRSVSWFFLFVAPILLIFASKQQIHNGQTISYNKHEISIDY